MWKWSKLFCDICNNPMINHNRACRQRRRGKDDDNMCNLCHRPLFQHRNFCQQRRGISPRLIEEGVVKYNLRSHRFASTGKKAKRNIVQLNPDGSIARRIA